MPDPVDGVLVRVPLFLPQVFALEALVDFVGFYPVRGDVFLVASTDGAAAGLADFVSDPELALAVQIDPDHPEILSLNERMEMRVGFTINGVNVGSLGMRISPGYKGD